MIHQEFTWQVKAEQRAEIGSFQHPLIVSLIHRHCTACANLWSSVRLQTPQPTQQFQSSKDLSHAAMGEAERRAAFIHAGFAFSGTNCIPKTSPTVGVLGGL